MMGENELSHSPSLKQGILPASDTRGKRQQQQQQQQQHQQVGGTAMAGKRRTSSVMLARKCPRPEEALPIETALLPESLMAAFALEEMERTNQMQFTSFLMLAEHVRQLSGVNPLALALNPLGAASLTHTPLNPFNMMLANQQQQQQQQHQQQQQQQQHMIQAAAVAAAMASQFPNNNNNNAAATGGGRAAVATTAAAAAAAEKDNRDKAAAATLAAAATIFSGSDRSGVDDMDERKRRAAEAETARHNVKAGGGEYNAASMDPNNRCDCRTLCPSPMPIFKLRTRSLCSPPSVYIYTLACRRRRLCQTCLRVISCLTHPPAGCLCLYCPPTPLLSQRTGTCPARVRPQPRMARMKTRARRRGKGNVPDSCGHRTFIVALLMPSTHSE